MSRQSFKSTLISSYADGPALSNIAGPQSILNPDCKWTFPAQYFRLGRVIRITGMVALSNIVTTPGTITLDVRLNGTVVWSSGAMNFSATAHTLLPCDLSITLATYADGSSSNFLGQGFAWSRALAVGAGADNTNSIVLYPMPTTSPAVGSNFDGTLAQQLDMQVTFSNQQTGNAITLKQFVLTSMN